MRINYPHGIVINGNIHALELNYDKSQEIDYLLGPQYSMLKKDFWDVPIRSMNKEINTIFISLGGSDLRNLTPKILKLIIDEFPTIFKKVIIGSSFKNIKKIENIADPSSELIYFPLASRMKEEIMKSDIAITTGGQTVYELAALGIPTITIAVAVNQLHNVKSFDKLGYNYNAGWWEDKNLLPNIKEGILNLKNRETRKNMIEKSRNIIKPDGSRRIIDYLIKKSK
jgi:spore coat polysaccharide biosynthesis predicted glycosyltransferase SpsG